VQRFTIAVAKQRMFRDANARGLIVRDFRVRGRGRSIFPSSTICI